MLLLALFVSWQYHVYMERHLADAFREASLVHISHRQFGADERACISKRLESFIKKYKACEDIPVGKLFRLCDDMNYITVQTSAHELEVIAWRMIELSMRRRFISSSAPFVIAYAILFSHVF